VTEAEWPVCGDPTRMLEFLRDKASDRKLRLFAVACCRDAVGVANLNWDRFQQDIDSAEQLAEGAADPPNRLGHQFGFFTIHHGGGNSLEWACHAAKDPSAWDGAVGVVGALDDLFWTNEETNYGGICVRDIFGNPFRPVNFESAWLTGTVVSLARQMYAAREFSAMPILADALQDAGCDNDDILNNCRDTSLPHVRGCWVIDLLTGRE
jgi:hypothetical protein